MKKIMSAAIFGTLAIIMTSTNAMAVELYVGLSGGQASTDTGVDATTGTASLDEDDTGFKFFAGAKLNEIVSIEGHYADFGEASLSGNNGDTFRAGGTTYNFTANNVKIAVEGTSIGIGGVAGYSINDVVRPYAKLGIHRWDLDATVSSDAGSASLSDDGTDAFYGIGVQISLMENVTVRGEYERFKFGSENVDFVSIGAAYSF